MKLEKVGLSLIKIGKISDSELDELDKKKKMSFVYGATLIYVVEQDYLKEKFPVFREKDMYNAFADIEDLIIVSKNEVYVISERR
ncbi:MAG: hypothetical protein N2V78_09550 [Methanophagales archaeon]|nr:hypothetical protein [Methanophagales archaeon]